MKSIIVTLTLLLFKTICVSQTLLNLNSDKNQLLPNNGINLPNNGINNSTFITKRQQSEVPTSNTKNTTPQEENENQSPIEKKLKKELLQLSNFQKLINNEKGVKLENYGISLFNDVNYKYPQNTPVPADYILGSGDEIDLKIWGSFEYESTVSINKEGLIYIPKVGSIQISGLRASNLDAFIRNKIKGMFNQFSSSATISKVRSIKIYFVGESMNPGSFTVSGLSSLIASLYESGGPTQLGNIRKIQLIRSGKLITTLDLYKFITQGDSSSDVRLVDGDVILIPVSKNRIALMGEVEKPGIYDILDTEKIEDLMKIVGLDSPTTSYEKIIVESIHKENFEKPRYIKEFNGANDFKKYYPQDGDLINFYPIKKEYLNSIIIRGNISTPRKYEFTPGMRISDLIPNQNELISPRYYELKNSLIQNRNIDEVSSNLAPLNFDNRLPSINWNYASIDRLEKDKFKSRLIAFNLYKAIHKDPQNDVELEPGDVITIYNSKDFKLPASESSHKILIQGEVKNPGYYEFVNGEKLADFLTRVGGTTERSYIYGSIFTRESIKENQLRNFEAYINRLQKNIDTTKYSLIQNADTADKQRIAQAEIAISQNSLERLKSIKPTGRLSLEINPLEPKLPQIILEDGDSIYIPRKSSVIEVIGAVFSETTFLYKENKTVNDYLKLAGTTKEADIEQIFVIRADGTSSSSFHKSFFQSDVQNATVYPGDTIVVPELVDRQTAYTKFIQGAKDWTSILYQFGLGAAGIKVLRNN